MNSNNLLKEYDNLSKDQQIGLLQNLLLRLAQNIEGAIPIPQDHRTEVKEANPTKDEDVKLENPRQAKLEDRPEAIGVEEKKFSTKAKLHSVYSDEFKKEAVILASQLNNNRKAARDLKRKYEPEDKYQGVNETVIREWRNNRSFNQGLDWDKSHKNRSKVKDSLATRSDMEYDLLEEFKAKRKEGKPVTQDWIKSTALRLAGDPSFKASNGWFYNFKKRAKLALRVATKVVQKLSEDYSTLLLDFIEKIRLQRIELEEKKGIKIIFENLDQVPFQFDMSTGTTYDFQGAKEIKIVKTKGFKQHFTVQLLILSTGLFLPPLFVFKSRGKIPEALSKKFKNKAVLYCNKAGWVTESILLDYLDRVWLNLRINSDKEKRFLIFDKFSVHTMETVKDKLTTGESLFQHIPADCTGLVQPLDTCINKPVKDGVRTHFSRWFDNEGSKDANKTKAGYLRAPKPEQLIEWILESCDKISPTLITKAFKHCSISHDL